MKYNSQNTKIKFYNIPFNKNGIDRFFHLSKDGKHKQVKELLKNHTPILELDDTNNTPKYVIGSMRFNNVLSLKITSEKTPIFNYCVIENTDKIFLDKEVTYWYAHISGQLIDFNNHPVSLSLDTFATYGIEYFTQLENKLVNYEKRHINRWIKQSRSNFWIDFKITGLDGSGTWEQSIGSGDQTSNKSIVKVSLPDNEGIWTKKDIEDYINEKYPHATIKTDLSDFDKNVNDGVVSNNFRNIVTIKSQSTDNIWSLLISGRNVSERGNIPNGKRAYIVKILKEETFIGNIYNYLQNNEGLSLKNYDKSIQIVKKYGDSASLKTGSTHLELQNKVNPFNFSTTEKDSYAFVFDTNDWDTANHVDFVVKSMTFKQQLEIEIPNNDKIQGLFPYEWLSFLPIFINSSLTPTKLGEAIKKMVDDLGSFKVLGKYYQVTTLDSPEDNHNQLTMHFLFKPLSKEFYIQNYDKTNELWTNNEFPQLLQAEGSHKDYIPIDFDNDFMTPNSTEYNKKLEKLPKDLSFGEKANNFYAIACRIMRNKLTSITKNNFYIYAVVASAGLEEHKIDLSKNYTSPEFPYVYIPIVNPQYVKPNSKDIDGFLDGIDFNDLPNLKNKLDGGWFEHNTISKIKEGLLESVLRVIVSPFPLIKKIASSAGSNDTERMYNTYFQRFKKTTKKVTFYYEGLKVHYGHLAENNIFDFTKIEEVQKEIELGKDLPKYINDDYLERNIEVSLLNNNYETHTIKDLLSTSPIPLDARRYYKYKRLLLNPKFVKDGMDYDIKFEGSNELQFYEQSFNYSFGISAAEKILQNQANARQAQLDRIQKNATASYGGIGIGALSSLIGGSAGAALSKGAGSLGNFFTPYAVQAAAGNIGQAGNVALATTLDDNQQRNVINSGIADSARSAPSISENIISESRLESPFVNINKNEIGYNMKPFTLIIDKPNKEFKKQIANAFNRNGYKSHIHERFSLSGIDTRYYWNFIQISNLGEITEEFNIPKNILFEMNEIIARGVRIHWLRDEKIEKDLSLANYEKEIVIENLVKSE